MNKFTVRQSLLLLLTATIWGTAFVAQSTGMEYIGPFTMNAIRCFLGGLVLLPVIFLMNRKKVAGDETKKTENNRTLCVGGILCGTLLCIASNLQQSGIKYTTVGKAGFITALYIIIVPILGIFARKKVGAKIWMGVVLAVAGLYLLCMKEGFSLTMGDSYVLASALFFSFHILVVDYFSPKADGVKLSCIQFFTCSILSGIGMVIWEQPQLSQILAAWLPICYAGILSCGVGYTLQIVGQKGMNPTVASLIMSLESVVAAIAGFLLLGQTMSGRELTGCILMFGAIILAQLPEKKSQGA